MGLGHSPRIVTDGLVFCVDAANTRSYPGTGTTWTDLKGGINGTLANNASFDGENGGSITFDGADDSVRFTSGMVNPDQDFTVSTFVRPADISTTKTIIADRVDQGVLQIRIISTNAVQVVDSYRVNVGTFSNFAPSANIWYNIVVVRSSNLYSLYVDGEFKSSFSSSNFYGTQPRTIGVNYNNTEDFNGKISNISCYNRALTPDEIRQNYLATKERYA